jgi:FG-GAP-like repeat/FG-GAP repeat
MKLLRTNFFIACIFCFCSTIGFGYAQINLDYDGKSDLLVYRASQGFWYGLSSENNTFLAIHWGIETDKIVAADYDGDGLTDVAVYRPSNGFWYVRKSSNGQLIARQWGLSTDELVPADYDNDGLTDFAVWRPSTGIWYLLTSSTGYNTVAFSFGTFGDSPVQADYDGDGKADFAVYRPRTLPSGEISPDGSRWYIWQSASQTLRFKQLPLSGPGFLLAPNDYSGDGKADICYMSNNADVEGRIYTYFRSENNESVTTRVGMQLGAEPVPDDYDNDGKVDFAIRESDYWLVNKSSTSQLQRVFFGYYGDKSPLRERIVYTRGF